MAEHIVLPEHSDDEALDRLLTEETVGNPAPSARVCLGRRVQVLGLAAISAALGAAWWSSSPTVAPQQAKASLPALSSLELVEKLEELLVAVAPDEALRRNEKRQRMVIEQDLKTTLELHAYGRQAHFEAPDGDDAPLSCMLRAQRLFEEVMEGSAMDLELEEAELHSFRWRFVAAMQSRCKDAISERLWIRAAGEQLQQQKPLLTAAVAKAINAADLGFKVKMHDWLVHESEGTKSMSLGLLPEAHDGQEDEIKHPVPEGRTAEDLPEVFRAELKWPHCKDEILRIHNQGHCGSCWAFGGLASVDARMCIATNGAWNSPEETLSRLHAVSCSNPLSFFHDGCQGGFPHWPMAMMASGGVASSQCLPYYIKGEGTEHFHHKGAAPPCETHCQGGYNISLEDDLFMSASIANYNRYRKVGWFQSKQDIMKRAIYSDGPVAFTFHVVNAFMGYASGVFSLCNWYSLGNHAVYAFGWGVVAAADGEDAVQYIEAANSWGSYWGDHGFFRIHPTCVVEVTIPGPIEKTAASHKVGVVDSSVPRDADNQNWPWPPPPECPYSDDGCIADPAGPSKNYTDSAACFSKRLNGNNIVLKEFDTEKGHDFLTINGKKYSGSSYRGFEPQSWSGTFDGIVVDDHGIHFDSDESKGAAGFRICIE